MSKSLETLQSTLPADVQSSILGSALQEVYVFVIDNGKADNLKTSLKKAGLKNIVSKTENGLTTVTGQNKQLFPVTSNAIVSPDASTSSNNCKYLCNNCVTITENACSSHVVGSGGIYYNCGLDGSSCKKTSNRYEGRFCQE